MTNLKLSEGIDYEKVLNEEQLRIVKEGEGPCLILAGPGSGKTRVLVYRVCWLLEKGFPPSSILLVTFTNKAAREMITRMEKLLGSYPGGLWAGTFHHIANVLLRRYGQVLGISSNYTIMDEEDSISVLKKITGEPDTMEGFPKPADIKKIFSLSVNTVESIKDVVNTRFPDHSSFIHRLETIWSNYQKTKRRLNLMDYDDLLLFCYKLLKNERTGSVISENFRYILVDEYHDTNRLQSLILYQLARVNRNIMVVGDDAQSIYSFRGATVNNIMEFTRIYPGAKIFYLDINYRSTPQILDFANKSILNNHIRYPKTLKSVRETGVKPVVVKCYSPRDEALFVSQRVFQLLNSGINPKDIGILFRSRYQAAELEIGLSRLKIPYIVRGGLRFFEQAHIKDIMAYFRVVENIRDEVSWRRLFVQTEGIGSRTADRLIPYISVMNSMDEIMEGMEKGDLDIRASSKLKALLALLKKIQNIKSIPAGIKLIMDSGYYDYIAKKYKDETERYQDIEMLKEIASAYSNLTDFISEASLQEYSKGEQIEKSSPLVLSTIHQAKGLEWKIVFIIGVSANHFPHPSSTMDIQALEEERRIFYVAVTRAKEDLYITYFTRDFYRTFRGDRSLFLEEIPEYLYEKWNF
ncbi:MAG TPA: ATP-dependent helicase [bacterium]|nr:ATP-dependent helicase [bacterium]HPP29650.1 ATP-dependent helicase [bacterium]